MKLSKTEWQETIANYGKLIKAIVIKRTGDKQLAEDIMIQVFLKLHEEKTDIISCRRKAWIISVTQSAITDYYRLKRARPEEVSLDLPAMGSGALVQGGYHGYVEDSVVQRDTFARIMRELRNKNEKGFEVLMMKAEGFSYSEISDYLNEPEGALRVRKNRAVQFVREKYEETYGETTGCKRKLNKESAMNQKKDQTNKSEK